MLCNFRIRASTPRSGRRGRWFESSHPDHFLFRTDFAAFRFFMGLSAPLVSGRPAWMAMVDDQFVGNPLEIGLIFVADLLGL